MLDTAKPGDFDWVVLMIFSGLKPRDFWLEGFAPLLRVKPIGTFGIRKDLPHSQIGINCGSFCFHLYWEHLHEILVLCLINE